MIITELYNGQGLGNQLFCYLTTRVIALDKGYDFGIMSPEKFKGKSFLDLDFGQAVIGGAGPEGGPPLKLPEGIDYYYNERQICHPETGVDIRIFDENLVNIPDKTKIDGVMQAERYLAHRKKEIGRWLKVKEEAECRDYANDDICVINFRGGEYVNVPDLFLPQKYWDDAIYKMRLKNPSFRFVVITDDQRTAKRFFPDFEVFHFDIGKDYSIIKNAHYLILSNSSFAWLPAWLSENLKFCIAPKYWARHNVSDGYWSCGYNITSDWHYLDREGNLTNYEECQKELDQYMEQQAEIFSPKKIERNFLVVTSHQNDLSWLPAYTDDYLVYDRNENGIYPPTLDPKKVIKQPNIGYNIFDYCSYIIDHYDNLPDCVIFMKGNTFPRHVSKEYFERIMNNRYFTPIEDYRMHKPYWPVCFFAPDGGFCEINNSWFLTQHPTKYFHDYNDFLRFCFKEPVIPPYNRFAPGANYIVPKEHILKYPKVFYENIRTFVSHCQLPGEAHIIERALHTLWTCNFELSEAMNRPIGDDFVAIPPKIRGRKAKIIALAKNLLARVSPKPVTPAATTITHKQAPALTPTDITAIKKYRQKIKIYDVFTFFNELELLEMRLNILEPYVDYFVIIECTETFSGRPKPLIYQENQDRFKKFKKKIIHYVTTDTPAGKNELQKRLKSDRLTILEREVIENTLKSDNIPKGAIHWLKEFYQKESIKKALIGLDDNDICYVGDVDEIWNPATIIDYRADDIFKLRQEVYPYYLNNRSDEPWAGTLVTKYKNIKNGCLNHMRTITKTSYTYVENGGWHFTNQGGPNRIRQKLESYGHQEFNNKAIKSQLEERIEQNQDFIGRNFKFWLDETGLPAYIKDNKHKYKGWFK